MNQTTKKRLLLVSALLAGSVAIAATIVGYQDWQLRGSSPGNPAAGYLRMWADNSAGFFKCLTSAGAPCYWAASPTSASAVQGNGTKFQLSTGSTTTNDCVKYDANGNTVDAGAACGGITLQTNGTNNGSQSTLNLAAGTNMTVTDNGSGTVTLAASGSGGSGALTLLSSQVLGSAVATVTFSTISGSYTGLLLKFIARSSTAGTQDVVVVQFNSDTATNYNYQNLFGFASTAQANSGTATANPQIGAIAGDTATAGLAGIGNIEIFGYAQTTFFKNAQCFTSFPSGSGSATQLGNYEVQWKSTSAITTIKLFLSTGANFKVGSVFSLYGIS